MKYNDPYVLTSLCEGFSHRPDEPKALIESLIDQEMPEIFEEDWEVDGNYDDEDKILRLKAKIAELESQLNNG